MSVTAAIVLTAAAADRLIPEPRVHPLAGFGRLADGLERRWNRPQRAGNAWLGAAAWALLVLPLTGLAALLGALPGWPGAMVSLLLLWLALGGRSLDGHARPVAAALAAGDLAAARQASGRMVSRDTSALDAEGCARATVESVLENGADAVFAPLFWFVVAGAPGVVAYRLANTLDAMWGYRDARFAAFGRLAARADDVLSWPAARLTALGYALTGRSRAAWRAWRWQAAAWDSPNAGPVMAAGAGALGLRLGGPAIYHGERRERPVLGAGAAPTAADIPRAMALVHRTLVVWLLAIGGGALLA